MTCVATFFSHFGAIRFKRECDARGTPAALMPVPRSLSSSCGTCVRYEGALPDALSDEVEQVVEETPLGYNVLYLAKQE